MAAFDKLQFVDFESMKGYHRLQGKEFAEYRRQHRLVLDGIAKSHNGHYCAFMHVDDAIPAAIQGKKISHWLNEIEQAKLEQGWSLATHSSVSELVMRQTERTMERALIKEERQ